MLFPLLSNPPPWPRSVGFFRSLRLYHFSRSPRTKSAGFCFPAFLALIQRRFKSRGNTYQPSTLKRKRTFGFWRSWSRKTVERFWPEEGPRADGTWLIKLSGMLVCSSILPLLCQRPLILDPIPASVIYIYLQCIFMSCWVPWVLLFDLLDEFLHRNNSILII